MDKDEIEVTIEGKDLEATMTEELLEESKKQREESEDEEQVIAPPKRRMDFKSALSMISSMLKGETINAKQASDLRAQIGVNNSYFTKRQITSTKRKAKRKADKLARRMNRGKVKGQKYASGSQARR